MLKNAPRGWCLMLVLLACNQLAEADDSEEDLLQKSTQASARGDFDQAIGVLTEVITKNPKQSLAFYRRGCANFRAGGPVTDIRRRRSV